MFWAEYGPLCRRYSKVLYYYFIFSIIIHSKRFRFRQKWYQVSRQIILKLSNPLQTIECKKNKKIKCCKPGENILSAGDRTRHSNYWKYRRKKRTIMKIAEFNLGFFLLSKLTLTDTNKPNIPISNKTIKKETIYKISNLSDE